MDLAFGVVMLLGIDLPRILLIALVFGLSGIPLAAWLMRKQKMSWLDTAILGYTLGWVGVPVLFTLQGTVGILYSPVWIYVNWLAVFLAGLALLFKDGELQPAALAARLQLPSISDPLAFIRNALPGIGLVLLLLITLLTRLTSSGSLIFELDPYFYMDGVRQVVYEGHNYYDDQTAWESLGRDRAVSHHVGQPLFKYLLAPWFSLYNSDAPYSPYALDDSSSVYPPIAAALAVFFLYLLFREMYHARAGLLAAGIGTFLPFFILKQQGGSAQIVPYSIFAVFFFLAMFYMMAKRRSWEFTALAGLGYAAIVLGSNIEILLVFCLSLFMFGIGLRHIISPDEESRLLNRQLLAFLGIALAVQVVSNWYGLWFAPAPGALNEYLKGWLSTLVRNIAVPAFALLTPLVFDWAVNLSTYKGPLSSRLQPLVPYSRKLSEIGRIERAGLFILALAVLVVLSPFIPGLDQLIAQYQFWGSYYEPLYRTIAEQAPGAPTFDSQFGFIAMVFSTPSASSGDLPNAVLSALLNLASGALAALNVIPTFLLNVFYNSFAGLLNGFLTTPDGKPGNFIVQDRANSLATFFLFFGPLLLAVRFLLDAAVGRKRWPLAPMMMLAFIVPITFMGFEKQKLLTYLGIALLFSAVSTFGEAEHAIRWLSGWWGRSSSSKSGPDSKSFWSGWPQPLQPRYLAWALVIFVILAQMSWPLVSSASFSQLLPYGPAALSQAWGVQLLASSFTPTFEQDPVRVSKKLTAFCQATGDSRVCGAVNDPNATRADPLKFYDSELCARSLWTDYSRPAPSTLYVAMQYRCGFISPYWIASMEWIHQNVPDGERIISWWDYGHWINFFGQKYAVLRNEHNSRDMIGRTAAAFLHGDTAELRRTMKQYKSRYALMDIEILGGGSSKDTIQFGGKYGALNYLGCAYSNQTDVNRPLGSSPCELAHLWETILVPAQPAQAQSCRISEETQATGWIAYRLEAVNTGTGLSQQPRAAYCVVGSTLQDGRQGVIAYDLDKRDANGDLQIHPALWMPYFNDGRNLGLVAVYDHQKLWPGANGTLQESYPYRRGAFYNSPLYQGFFLDRLEGFDLVYNSPQIRIFRMTDEYYNKPE